MDMLMILPRGSGSCPSPVGIALRGPGVPTDYIGAGPILNPRAGPNLRRHCGRVADARLAEAAQLHDHQVAAGTRCLRERRA